MRRLDLLTVIAFGVLLFVFTVGTQAINLGGNSGGGNGNNSNQGLKGKYTFRLVPATSFAPFYDGTAGKPDSGIATAPRQDVLRVGVFTADGRGNLTGRMIATTDNGLMTIVIDFNFSGTYTINSDGTGAMSIAPIGINSCKDGDGVSITVGTGECTFSPTLPSDASEGPETYALVLNNHGSDKLLSMIQTDNVGGGAKIFLTGDAKQNSGD